LGCILTFLKRVPLPISKQPSLKLKKNDAYIEVASLSKASLQNLMKLYLAALSFQDSCLNNPDAALITKETLGCSPQFLHAAVLSDLLLFLYGYSPLTVESFAVISSGFHQWRMLLCAEDTGSVSKDSDCASFNSGASPIHTYPTLSKEYSLCGSSLSPPSGHLQSGAGCSHNLSQKESCPSTRSSQCYTKMFEVFSSLRIDRLLHSTVEDFSVYIQVLLEAYHNLSPSSELRPRLGFVMLLMIPRHGLSKHFSEIFLENMHSLITKLKHNNTEVLPFLLSFSEKLSEMLFFFQKYQAGTLFLECSIQGNLLLQNRAEVIRLQRALGVTAFSNGDNYLALDLYLKLLQTSIDTNNRTEFVYMSTIIADLLIEQGRFADADHYLTAASRLEDSTAVHELQNIVLVPSWQGILLPQFQKPEAAQNLLPRNSNHSLRQASNECMHSFSEQSSPRFNSHAQAATFADPSVIILDSVQFELQMKRVDLALRSSQLQHALDLSASLYSHSCSLQQCVTSLFLLSRCRLKAHLFQECSELLDTILSYSDYLIEEFSAQVGKATNSSPNFSASFDTPERRHPVLESTKPAVVINMIRSFDFLILRARSSLAHADTHVALHWLSVAAQASQSPSHQGTVHYISACAYKVLVFNKDEKKKEEYLRCAHECFVKASQFYGDAGNKLQQTKCLAKSAEFYLSFFFKNVQEGQIKAEPMLEYCDMPLINWAEEACNSSLEICTEMSEPMSLLLA